MSIDSQMDRHEGQLYVDKAEEREFAAGEREMLLRAGAEIIRIVERRIKLQNKTRSLGVRPLSYREFDFADIESVTGLEGEDKGLERLGEIAAEIDAAADHEGGMAKAAQESAGFARSRLDSDSGD